MTLMSMTGFARVTGESGNHRFVWEIKTVNAKGLDVRLRTPPGFDEVGEDTRKKAAAVLRRGTCFVSLNITREHSTPAVRINEALLEQLVALADRYRDRDGLRPPSLDGLLAVRGVVEIDEASEDEAALAALKKALATSCDEALQGLQAMRGAEGAALNKILGEKIDDIARLTDQAEQSPAR